MSTDQQARQRYTTMHWGISPGREIRINDPLLPDRLVDMGELRWLYVDPPPKNEERAEQIRLGFPIGGWVAIESGHPVDRIHLPLPRKTRAALKRRYWDPRTEEWGLAALADVAGGRQARYPFPEIMVAPIGVATHVIYYTEKGGETPPGPSEYIHEFGEESGIRPYLAVDATGRLWLAGGDYTVPREGIKN